MKLYRLLPAIPVIAFQVFGGVKGEVLPDDGVDGGNEKARIRM
jgi:hypothetical protein